MIQPSARYLVLTCALATLLSGAAHATMVYHYDGLVTATDDGEQALVGAEVQFTVASGMLHAQLSNTGSRFAGAADKRLQGLGGLFFTIPDGVTLTPDSCVLAAGSDVYDLRRKSKRDPITKAYLGDWDGNGSLDDPEDIRWQADYYPNIGSEWVSSSTFTGGPGAANMGASAVGYGIFGANDTRFSADPVHSLVSPATVPAGGDLSILPQGFDSSSSSLKGTAWASDTITLSWVVGGTAAFAETDVLDPWFAFGTNAGQGAYGTAKLGSPPPPAVPEPASCALLVCAIGGMGVGLKRRRKA